MKPLLTLVMAALTLPLGANSALAACTEQVVQFSVSPTNAYADQTISVSYQANRTDCSNTGSFTYPITIGGSSSAELGQCKGNRTKDSVQCSGEFLIPEGFTGAMVVQVNGQSAKINVAKVNTAPIAQHQTVSTSENTPLDIELQASDPEGDELVSYQLLKMPNPQDGDVSLTGSTVRFAPTKDWNGTAEFTFRVQDSSGNWSQEAGVKVLVGAANSAPKITSKTYVGVEDNPLPIVPVVTDPDGDTEFTFDLTGDPAEHGQVTVTQAGVSYVPNEDWSGEDSFWLTATDSDGAVSEPALIKVQIQPENDAPVLTPIAFSVVEDESGSAPIAFLDVDGDGPYVFTVVGQPALSKGVCSVSGSVLQFTPAKDWVGTTTCSLVGIDAGGARSKPVDATITVTNVNDAPAVDDVTATLSQGETRTLALTLTDPDAGDSHVVRLVSVADPNFAEVSVVGKSVKVVLAPQFSGSQMIQVVAEDAQGAVSSPATLYLTVLPVNKPPVVKPVTLQAALNTPVTLKLAASDPNNDAPLTFALTQNTTSDKGSFSLSGADLTFTPKTGFVGTAVAKVTATDPGGATSAEATVTVQVTADQVVATDPDIGDTHSIIIVSQPPASVGTVTATGMKVTFEPVQGYFGSATFTYKVRDADGLETDVVTGDIEVEKYNYAPTSVGGSATVLEGETVGSIPLTVVDPNPYDQGQHVFSLPVQSIKGFAQVVGNQLSYQAPVGFTGSVVFDVVATDPGGLSVKGKVTVQVNQKNYAPSSVSLDMSTTEGVPVTGVPVVVDRNPQDTHTFKVLSQPSGGVVETVAGGIKFTPQAGWTGRAIFDIEATDPSGFSVTGKGFVSVSASNAAPTRIEGHIRVPENTPSAPYYPIVIDPNQYDKGRHTIAIVSSGDNGSASVIGNNIIYTPKHQFVGSDSIKVKATDVGGQDVVGDISIEVYGVNQAPLSASLRMYAREGQPSGVTRPVIHDENVWDVFSYEVVTQPKYGEVLAFEDGYVYTPNPGFYGNDTFNFRVVDAGGEYVEGVAVVSITLENYAPTSISPEVIHFIEGVGVEQRMRATDPNGWDDFVFTVLEQPSHGNIWFDNNNLVYKTEGSTDATAVIRVTDQKGLYYDASISLKPRAVADAIKDLPVVEVENAIRTPGVVQPMRRTDGAPGFMLYDEAILSSLGTDIVAVLQADSSKNIGKRPPKSPCVTQAGIHRCGSS